MFILPLVAKLLNHITKQESKRFNHKDHKGHGEKPLINSVDSVLSVVNALVLRNMQTTEQRGSKTRAEFQRLRVAFCDRFIRFAEGFERFTQSLTRSIH